MNSYQQWKIVVKFNIPLFRYFYNHLINCTKTRLVNIGEYSPRLRLGEYSPIFTLPSANNCLLLKLDHWIMQMESFHWLSHHGI